MRRRSVLALLAAVVLAFAAAGCDDDSDLSEAADSVATEAEARLDEARDDLEDRVDEVRDDVSDEVEEALDEAGDRVDELEESSREQLEEARASSRTPATSSGLRWKTPSATPAKGWRTPSTRSSGCSSGSRTPSKKRGLAATLDALPTRAARMPSALPPLLSLVVGSGLGLTFRSTRSTPAGRRPPKISTAADLSARVLRRVHVDVERRRPPAKAPGDWRVTIMVPSGRSCRSCTEPQRASAADGPATPNLAGDGCARRVALPLSRPERERPADRRRVSPFSVLTVALKTPGAFAAAPSLSRRMTISCFGTVSVARYEGTSRALCLRGGRLVAIAPTCERDGRRDEHRGERVPARASCAWEPPLRWISSR